MEYAESAGSGIGRYRSQAIFEVDHLLIYMANRGLIGKSVGFILNKFICGDFLAVDNLPTAERNRFNGYAITDDGERERSREAFSAAADKLCDTNISRGYSPTIQYIDSQAIRTFSVFMDANHYGYSPGLAAEWLKYNRGRWKQGKYTGIRRVLLCIDEIIRTGTYTSQRYIDKEPKYLLPPWGKLLAEEYRAYRAREGCAPSTLGMIRDSCGRFLVFLDSRGVGGPEDIKPDHLKEFHEADSHRSVEGKNGYAIKIRGFLRWLAEKGLAPPTLELAVVTDMAPRTDIVSVLAQNQSDAIYLFRSTSEDPLELRNTAIIMLGLRMGLRASDIAGLKLRDISFEHKRISIVQQKTGVFLELPIPTDVGNSVYKYLKAGRPLSDDPHIFIRHSAPYCGMCGTHFDTILNAVVRAGGSMQIEPTHGFHITRRTFASGLLQAGNNVDTISAALGHVGNKGVDPYLSTNGDRMRLCAIGLKGIEYKGGIML
jgi:integrase